MSRKMNRRDFIRLGGLAAAGAVVAACGATPTATPVPPTATKPPAPTNTPVPPAAVPPTATKPPAPTNTPVPPTATPVPAKPLKVAILSDVAAGSVIYHPHLLRGFEMGVAYATKSTSKVAGREIQIIVKDTESKADVGVSRAREAIEKDGCEILVGTPSSAVALAVAPVALEYKKLFLVTPAAADAITGANFNKYVFRTASNASQDAAAGAKAAMGAGKNFVGLAMDISWGHDQITAWKAVVEKNGGKFVNEIYVPATTTDFTAYLQKVLDTKDAQVLFMAWAGSLVALIQQMNELGVNKKLAVATGIGDNVSLAATGDILVGFQGMMKYHYTFPKNAVNDWLVTEHTKKYQVPPDLFTDTSFAAAQALVMGLEKTAGDATADKLIPVLEGLIWDAPKGKFTLRKEDHQALQPMYYAEITKGPDGKPLPKLLKEISAEDCAPPIVAPK